EWIEKSVALSEECSKDVIEHSIRRLDELKKISTSVPHKILAVGCSITHAEDLYKWYTEKGLRATIIHSEMEPERIAASFKEIDNNNCDVVISVNMLMEGYDHKYLSILAIFRPYRSLNAFAQVVGRILRAIPDNEIAAFEIDNNGLVIFHEEIGLNVMWDTFQKEVDRAKRASVREYIFSDRDYVEREQALAGIASDGAYVSETDSYLDDIDFNALFEQKRAEISEAVSSQIEKIRLAGITLSDSAIEGLKKSLVEEEARKVADIIDPELIEKRPHIARKRMREILKTRTQDEVANLLNDKGIGEKSSELYDIFGRHMQYIAPTDANDGILMRYINLKLSKAFGRVDERDNKTLLQSIDALPGILKEVERMIR
ncbi:TPA: DEAD/DEAH box helicase, partial [Yersinia enterocolitica]